MLPERRALRIDTLDFWIILLCAAGFVVYIAWRYT
jgi:hypothetical protein